jgi:hypothetical protein
MQLYLSDEEADLLRDVLETVVRDLSPEIADTDNAAYRRELIARREQLNLIVLRLNASAKEQSE